MSKPEIYDNIKIMIIGVLKETCECERRVALLPSSIQKLVQNGAEIHIESGLAAHLNISDKDYENAGAVISSHDSILSSSDIFVHVRKPDATDVAGMKSGAIHISFLDPFQDTDIVENLINADITAISMEMIPRTTIAQKMDALSSQASLAGYYAVILAAERLNKVFPMMTTPAGTIKPARVFVIGAGVAGLQAIATAKRLGARVDAFDTRPIVEEQVKSLGAKFVKIDLGETGQTDSGYAKQLTDDQLELQRQGMAKICAQSDIVITTAQIFGKKAPRIISKEMISQMQPGSIIVDMAVESGGNVEGSEIGKEIDLNGITIIGVKNLPAHIALDASQMYSNNITNLLLSSWNEEQKAFLLDLENEILNKCVVTHAGEKRI